jgi:glucose dehydrogenase
MKKSITIFLILMFSVSIIFQANNLETEATNNSNLNNADRLERNWEFVNHDQWGTNYSPQNYINRDNVHLLELKWTYPFPPASEFLRYQQGGIAFEGVITPPLIIDGDVFVSSNMKNVYSFDAKSGNMNWIRIYEHDWDKAKTELPEVAGGAPHIHGLQFVDEMLFTSTLNCSVEALNYKSGNPIFEIDKICSNVEGNNYSWPMYQGIGKYGSPSHPGPIYQKDNILVVAITGATAAWGGGRAFIDGYDLDFDPPKRLWRTFLAPPAEGDPEWALHECDKGWFFSYPEWKESGRMGIPCSEVPQENLMNDWGVPKHYISSVAAVWGQMALDQETGIVYFGTGNQGGWPNQTLTTGPNLYSAATLAVDVKTGNIVWWYQQVTRDMVEGDSSWNTILTELTINGEKRKAIIKYSVTGLLWALDASTGEPLWIFESPLLKSRVDPDGITRGRTSGHPCIGCDPKTQDGYWNNVLSYYDMQEKKWLNYPSTDWFYWIPARAGEADIALDTDLQKIFVPVAGGVDKAIKAGKYGTLGIRPGQDYYIDTLSKNVTLYSLDANTGEEVWSYFIDGVAYRGGVMASGGVIFLPVANGNLYMFNAENGELIDKIFLGNSLLVLPTIGYTSEGEARLFVISGGRGAYAIGGITRQNIPGAIFSFGLPEEYQKEKIEDVEQPIIEEQQIQEQAEEVKQEIDENIPIKDEVSEDNLLYYLLGIGLLTAIILLIIRRSK